MLISFMAALPEDAVIFLRRGLRTDPGMFERDVETLAGLLRLEVEWHQPEPTDVTPGRSSVYARDISMVEQSDLVIAFLTLDDVEGGYSGSSHVIDKALAANRPVYAYSVDEFGTIERVGDYDPDELYASLAPSVPVA